MSEKVGFIADVHIGNHKTLGGQMVASVNERARQGAYILAEAARRAAANGCSTLVVLGDLFDTDCPSPQLVATALRAFKDGPRRVYLLPGNHDMRSMTTGDHALGPFNGVRDGTYFTVAENPVVAHIGGIQGGRLVLIPFRNGRASDWIRDSIKAALRFSSKADDAVLCLHLGLADKNTEPWMKGAHDSLDIKLVTEIVDEFGFAGVAAGNWHHHQTWEGNSCEPIWQMGALVPTGWNNVGGDESYGTLAIWDGTWFERIVIHGPRYLTFTDYQQWLPYAGDERIRARIVVPATRVGMTQAKVEAEGPMGFCEVIPDEKTTQRRIRSAAVAARAAAGSDQALVEYVKRVELPPNIQPAEVIAAVKSHLGGVP